MTSNAESLEPGKRYFLRYRLYGQRRDRTAVMDFMAEDSQGVRGGHLLFSARPLAGTQSLPKEALLEWRQVGKDMPIHLNRKD
jgi:hypothetical protein